MMNCLIVKKSMCIDVSIWNVCSVKKSLTELARDFFIYAC